MSVMVQEKQKRSVGSDEMNVGPKMTEQESRRNGTERQQQQQQTPN